MRRGEELDPPLLVLSESIVNAICYRDYAMQGSQPKVEVFADNVEVVSQGTLPKGISLADLCLGASEIRNRQTMGSSRKSRLSPVCASTRSKASSPHGISFYFIGVAKFFSGLLGSEIWLYKNCKSIKPNR